MRACAGTVAASIRPGQVISWPGRAANADTHESEGMTGDEEEGTDRDEAANAQAATDDDVSEPRASGDSRDAGADSEATTQPGQVERVEGADPRASGAEAQETAEAGPPDADGAAGTAPGKSEEPAQEASGFAGLAEAFGALQSLGEQLGGMVESMASAVGASTRQGDRRGRGPSRRAPPAGRSEWDQIAADLFDED